LQELRWDDLHLNDSPAWGTLRPEINKTRVAERFPIREEVAAELRNVKGKTGRVFKEVPTADDLRADWLKAGVAFSDASGNRRLDLHSFRRTAIELLRQQGVPLREAREILHHKDERTTARYYGERPDPVTIAAVEKLPDLS
jgi:integrase